MFEKGEWEKDIIPTEDEKEAKKILGKHNPANWILGKVENLILGTMHIAIGFKFKKQEPKDKDDRSHIN